VGGVIREYILGKGLYVETSSIQDSKVAISLLLIATSELKVSISAYLIIRDVSVARGVLELERKGPLETREVLIVVVTNL
jgi:hypothetical protein